jgi:transcriptional regulator with XRE-family HTH domain
VPTFSYQLRSLRAKRQLTQAGLAGRSGVHVAQVSRYENGLRPTLEHVVLLARALNVDVRELADPALAHAAANSPTSVEVSRG